VGGGIATISATLDEAVDDPEEPAGDAATSAIGDAGGEDPDASGLPVLLSEEASRDPSTRGNAGLERGVAGTTGD
jgi:hypothetical protein